MSDLVLRFGKEFTKLPVEYSEGILNKATLLQVIPSKFELLSDAFKDYDGCYIEDKKIKFWKFPEKGDCLILFFESVWMKDKGLSELFTTVRKRNAENESYYLCNVGREFKVKLERI